ncbi:GlsB/YeaQ/YmgE family stress response membrane protein [Gymnodinialimonas ceratoperidinii]|uniref:GlsB/YeaQ/YmgE family stress response membrane protein n=1 Tax=Gymnodinialimonas ceratoperidinii TaxID=2856823 RepID=A0A8F6TXS7_9RHOB|nr:GlsB/YeaQ/YmgE family stress response membrane protein [Gymnodinialimonas ceratoperidinii]QXT40129.1 GlsB/YeaQ/YmgE family stress response membrane protein [Gymnodinialimonas ceratoperidinii]
MQGLGFLAAIIVGGLAGWIASRFMGARTGILINIILGILGAVVANFLLRLVGIVPTEGWIAQGIVGFLGACILIVLWRMIRGR